MIKEISANNVLSIAKKTLGLEDDSDILINDVLLSCLIRRAAAIFCPCSPATLRSEILSSLQYLHTNEAELSEYIEDVIDGLVISGDLLELNQVTIDSDSNVKGTWIFSASPGFIVRPSGSIFLTGIAPDEMTALPESLACRIKYKKNTRYIIPEHNENMPSILRELGLVELSERSWLKSPKQETANDFHQNMIQRLMSQPPSGNVSDLMILDSDRNPDYYKGRWIKPKKETGTFVARRAQLYGTAIWCFVNLEDGVVNKFIDFPLPGKHLRGRDFAWCLQIAIDHQRSSPQRYRVRASTEGAYLDFFSPLPSWAERRLSILGSPMLKHQCLFTYFIPERELQAEEEFLQKNIWLVRADH